MPISSPKLSVHLVRQRLAEQLGRRITQQEFGQTVGLKEGRAPWPHSTVSRWESGRLLPGPASMAAMAALIGVPVVELEPARLGHSGTEVVRLRRILRKALLAYGEISHEKALHAIELAFEDEV